MSEFLSEAGATAVWIAVALALMAVGFAVVDVLTPGRLREQVSEHVNAAVMVAAKLLAVAVIVATAVATAPDSLSEGVAQAAAYGVAGLAVSAVAFLALDAVLPARVRDLVTVSRFDPSVIVVAGAELGIALVIAAAVS
jgi:uncharacterized membrane protein YjfL (UPF0719 family)